MYKVIALIGKAGSGKDTIARALVEQNENMKFVVSYTTRPPREKEINGVNYHFVSVEEFEKLDLFDKEEFNNWKYGTGYSSFDPEAINIGIFNPAGIRTLYKQPNIDLQVYYIVATDKERLLRQLNREKHPDVGEIVRRFTTDEKDFENLGFEPFLFWNETPDAIQSIVKTITKGQNKLKNLS